MDKAKLVELRTKAEAEFNELEQQRQQIIARQSELRGQYQILNQQIDEPEVAKPAKKVSK